MLHQIIECAISFVLCFMILHSYNPFKMFKLILHFYKIIDLILHITFFTSLVDFAHVEILWYRYCAVVYY